MTEKFTLEDLEANFGFALWENSFTSPLNLSKIEALKSKIKDVFLSCKLANI